VVNFVASGPDAEAYTGGRSGAGAYETGTQE